MRITQWPYDEFAPIAQAINALMEQQGWAQKDQPSRSKRLLRPSCPAADR